MGTEAWITSMTSSREECGACSPESTISSLLTSCSVDSNNLCSRSFIHYKDKLYSSASEALEAYIEDFHLSLTSSEISTGKIHIYQSTPQKVKISKHRAKQNHAPADFTQHLGSASLASASGKQSERDPDLISLATDDLLALPADGSLPFIQHPPVKSRHQQSREWNRCSLTRPFCSCQTSALGTERYFRLPANGEVVPHQHPHEDFGQEKCSLYTPAGCDSLSSKGSSRPLSFEKNSNAFPVKNYPRWLTSQKSTLSVSGISSIPNFHYPVWLKSCNLFPDSPKESSGQTYNIRGAAASSSEAFEMLEKRCSGDKDSSDGFEQNDCLEVRGDNEAEGSCNYDPRFQFNNSFSRHTKKLFREELLTLRADRDLESSTEELSNCLVNDDSPSTTAILGAERLGENPPGAFKPPAPACSEVVESPLLFPKAEIIQKFLEDCLNDKNKENTFPEGHDHRPLEALKLMLFKLQAIQGSLNWTETAELKEELEKLLEKAEAELKLCHSEMIPLTNSIRKALHHLSHLKSLVKENSTQQEQTHDCEEEKQEQENDL